MSTRTRMRSVGVILAAAATAILVFAVPAGAKKPAPLAPSTYTAEISYVVPGEGIATTCADPLTDPLILTRTEVDGGSLTHFESTGATLSIDTDEPALAWMGEEIGGCHGSEVVPEYFRITLHSDHSVAMLWIFDVESHETTVTMRNGKQKTAMVRTDFRMGGPYDAAGEFATASEWTEAEDGSIAFTVTGSFTFVEYESGPTFVELDNSPRTFTLEVTLTPNPA